MNGLLSMAAFMYITLFTLMLFQPGHGNILTSDFEDIEITLLDILERLESLKRLDEETVLQEFTGEEGHEERKNDYLEGMDTIL